MVTFKKASPTARSNFASDEEMRAAQVRNRPAAVKLGAKIRRLEAEIEAARIELRRMGFQVIPDPKKDRQMLDRMAAEGKTQRVRVFGVEYPSVGEAARALGVTRKSITQRLTRGVDAQRID